MIYVGIALTVVNVSGIIIAAVVFDTTAVYLLMCKLFILCTV